MERLIQTISEGLAQDRDNVLAGLLSRAEIPLHEIRSFRLQPLCHFARDTPEALFHPYKNAIEKWRSTDSSFEDRFAKCGDGIGFRSCCCSDER
jgi:hypothetical protein